MRDRVALLESALDSLPEGLALLDREGEVVFWNQAAGEITGRTGAEVVARLLPDSLAALVQSPPGEATGERGTLVRLRHGLGHEVAAIARRAELSDESGEPLGTAVFFHPAQRLDALPHGSGGNGQDVEAGREEFEERLRAEYEDFERGGQPLGVLWISVDQGAELRKTHGMAATEAMLVKMEHALAHGLRPAEELGRWGEEEFLVIAHERTAEMLAAHARTLAGQARTADFRWWGDRISLTVSVGAAQAREGEPLEDLVERARAAMENCLRGGGNGVICAPGGSGTLTESSGGRE
ncbi:MAG: diguanylate cyclase domain-containing protein [Acidobacteriota bacterium]